MKYDIYLTGEIGWSITANYVKQQLSQFEGKPCSVYLSSLGGEVNEALKIYQQFRDHGNVTVYLFGFNASAATIIAMGAKEIVMSKFALFLVHCSSTFTYDFGRYNAEDIADRIAELMEQKDCLEKVDEVIANIYALRTSSDVKEVVDLMKEDKWLKAEEAKEAGFVDRLFEQEEKEGATAAQLSPVIAARITAHGLPMPNCERSDEQPKKKGYPLPSEDRKERVRAKDSNLLQRVATALGLSMPKEEEEEEPAPIPDETNEEMRKELQEKNSTIAQLTERVRAMERQIEKLGREDGDSSTKVEPQPTANTHTTHSARATYQQLKNILKK